MREAGRRHPGRLLEAAAEVVLVAKADSGGDVVDPGGRSRQQLLGLFDSQGIQITGRRLPRQRLEEAAVLPATHVGFPRELTDLDLLPVSAVKVVDRALDGLPGVLRALPLGMQPLEHFVKHCLESDMEPEVVQSAIFPASAVAVQVPGGGEQLCQLILQSGVVLEHEHLVAGEQAAGILLHGEECQEVGEGRGFSIAQMQSLARAQQEALASRGMPARAVDRHFAVAAGDVQERMRLQPI